MTAFEAEPRIKTPLEGKRVWNALMSGSDEYVQFLFSSPIINPHDRSIKKHIV